MTIATGCGATSRDARCSCSPQTACRSRSPVRTVTGPPPQSSMPAGVDSLPESSARACAHSVRDSSPRRSARASARAATKSGRRWPSRSARRSATTSCATVASISGRRPSVRCAPPVSSTWTAAISARPVTPSGSSRIAATTAAPGARGSSPTSIEEVRDRYRRICEEVGERVTVVVATKYVTVDELGVLADAGVRVVGENRAQDLAAKHERWGDAFRWHFIGHLQSRKAKTVNEICELCHSLSSESAAEKLTIPALVEVNLSGEPTKSGIAPEALGEFVSRYPAAQGLMTMPPWTDDPEASRTYFRRLRELAEEHGLRELSMGTSQDYRIAVEEGATFIRVGSTLFGDRRPQ